MLFGQVALGQSDIQPLHIGDPIPDELWNLPLHVVNHPDGKDTITLNDYRDKKLIILDFWATWCVPCIRSIMDVDSLLRVYDGDQVCLLPVNRYDSEGNMLAFIKEHTWKFPSVINSKDLDRILMSAYREYLGMVWIRDGVLFAVPKNISVTHENILYALTGQTEKMRMSNYPLRIK